MPKITHILLDCDNTLVQTEHLAFAACATLLNTLLSAHSIPAHYTGPALQTDFVGQNFRGMLLGLRERYGVGAFKPPLTDEEVEGAVGREEEAVIAKIREEAEACEGCNEELARLYDEEGGRRWRGKMAVVSSSALRRVRASLEKAGQTRFFEPEHVFSAASSLPTPTSKPDPAVYLHACRVLGVEPGQCLAVEDSRSGATSALRAGVGGVVGYVGCYSEGEEREKAREMMMGLGVEVVMGDWREFGGCLERVEAL